MKKLIILLFATIWVIFFNHSAKAMGDDIEELGCLAKNICFEAKSQSNAGQISVALVVMNRVKDSRFPNTICEVVYQGPVKESWKTRQYPDLEDHKRIYYPKRHQCQFSWYCDGKSDRIWNEDAFARAFIIAKRVIAGQYDGYLEGATHYHATYVNPDWAKTKTLITQVGDHIFYRWD